MDIDKVKTHMKTAWIIICLGALLLLAPACSEDDPAQPGPEPCPPVENPTPNLQLEDLDGQAYDISNDHCQTMVLLAFGTTWCRYCADGLPEVQEIHETYQGQGLRVMAVYYERDLELLKGYFADKNTTFRVLQDDHGFVSYFWDARTIPTYVLVSLEGEEVYRVVGYAPGYLDELKTRIKSYLEP